MDSLYGILKHAHSGFRWVVLALLVITVLNALMKMIGNKSFTASDGRLVFLTPRSMEIQFILGIILYFISPMVNFSDPFANELTRFYTVEHISTMIIAVGLVSVGSARVRRMSDSGKRFRTTLIFFGISLVLVLAMIPWPPRFGAGWF